MRQTHARLLDAAVASTHRAGAAVDRAMDEIDASNQRIALIDGHVKNLKGMVPAGAQPVPVEAMKIGGQTLKEMIEDGRM